MLHNTTNPATLIPFSHLPLWSLFYLRHLWTMLRHLLSCNLMPMCFIAISVKVTSQLSIDSIHVMFVTFQSLLVTASKRNTGEFSMTYLNGDDLLSVFLVSISVQVASQFSLESSHLILVAFQSPFVIGLLQTTQKKKREIQKILGCKCRNMITTSHQSVIL